MASAFWRNNLSILLGSDRVRLVRASRGVNGRVIKTLELPCASTESAGSTNEPWSAPLAALETCLAAPDWRNTDVDVILTNAFVRYGLVRSPASDLTPDEITTLARHFFRNLGGEAADEWSFRTCDLDGETLLTSAITQKLAGELSRLFQRPAYRLRSIQPVLVPAANHFRQILEKQSGQFLMVEKNLALIATLEQGRWKNLVVRHLDMGRAESVLAALEQSVRLAESSSRQLFLFASEAVDKTIFRQWKVQELAMPVGSVLANRRVG